MRVRARGIGRFTAVLWPRTRPRRILLLALSAPLVLVVLFTLAAWLVPFPEGLLTSIPASQVVTDCTGAILRVYPNADGNFMIPVALKEISPHVAAATCAIEDRRFWLHWGVDPAAVARALWQDLTSFRVVSGASTITMQVVRLLEDRPRTLWSKVVESFRALQLERRLSKKEILALYLTLAPYGGNVYGIEAASLAYFGKRARALSLPEAALLAGLPQSPPRLRPDRYPERALKRRNLVLWALVRDGLVPYEEARTYLFEEEQRKGGEGSGSGTRLASNPYRRRPFPFHAPQFCRLVAGRRSGEALLQSTLDLRLQQRVEELLRQRVDRLDAVTNAACVVVDNESGDVLAYVGSRDFWSEAAAGQVDGLHALRSPGSTLKPLLYALSYAQGTLAPDEVLPDLPLLASAWCPENFDKTCHGLVPAQKALARSYNLTAVRLLSRYGVERFLDFLATAHLGRPRSGAAGLSVILGALEVRPIDLVRSYMTLARFGQALPLRLTAGEQPVEIGAGDTSHRHVSPEACYLVSQALTRSKDGLGGIAWKTGTSWGKRDAWTVAYTPRLTVCVWMGNFSGEGAPALVGAEAAMPAALQIVNWLDPRPLWPDRPQGIERGAVCAETGLPAGAFCPHVVQGRVLKGSRRTCTVHRRFPVDEETGHLVCRSCLTGKTIVWKSYAVWPPDVEAYLQAHGKEPLPDHCPSCATVRDRGGPKILSPASGKRYLLAERRLPVRVFTRDKDLYFFLDGVLIDQRDPEFLLPVSAGWHSLGCVDARGVSAHVTFQCVAD